MADELFDVPSKGKDAFQSHPLRIEVKLLDNEVKARPSNSLRMNVKISKRRISKPYRQKELILHRR